MSTRKLVFSTGEFYHLYNRGADKRITFTCQDDYIRFQELLYAANSELAISIRDIRKVHDSVYEFETNKALVAIGAYCLMPNHFHILLTPITDGGVSKFMNKLTTAYTMYFNLRNDRSGSLFQGTYKSEHADTDEYLKYLYSYIHLNPVKLIDSTWKEEGIKDAVKAYAFTASYCYSSLPDYLGNDRPESAIINPQPFPAYFTTAASHQAELMEWLDFKAVIPSSTTTK